jgi:hypothetical protein
MSDEKKVIKFKTVKSNALINIQIGGKYFTQLQNMLQWFYLTAPSEEACIKTIQELHTRQPQTPWEESFFTFFCLLMEIESQAEKQGMVMEEERDVPSS